MCRIFGISYGKNPEDLATYEIAQILYPALVSGGPHAWGWMSYNAETNAITHDKYAGRADTKEANAICEDLIDNGAGWFVGHVRFATHGSPEDNRNNHPLAHGNIIGVHNGILRNHEEILKITGRQDPKTLVDSEAIFAAVNKWGPKNGLAKIKGDMVTLYSNYDRPHVLHLGRTHGRQITLGWTDRGNLLFASEERALHELAPWINFVKFSTVSENRLLLIRDGSIIQRLTFAPPVKRYIPPPATVMARRPVTADQLSKELEMARAQRRGEMLFPRDDSRLVVSRGKKKGKGKRSRPKPIDHEINEIVIADGVDEDGIGFVTRGGDEERKLYYFDGELLTRDEYEIAVQNRD